MLTTDQLVDGQLDTFHVDSGGRLVHHWFTVKIGWDQEVLATGGVPHTPIGFDAHWRYDQMSHLFVESPGGGQIHRYWDGKVWHGDTQPPPAS